MLSKEDQRRFEQIARNLRATDPEFAARVGGQAWTRRSRLLVVLSILLWATVPPMTVVGGWFAATLSVVALVGAGLLLLMVQRRHLGR